MAKGAVTVAVWCVVSRAAWSSAHDTVLPTGHGSVQGDARNRFPFFSPQRSASMRYQQIFDRSEFDDAGTITGISFRLQEGRDDETASEPFASVFQDIRVCLSTSLKDVIEPTPLELNFDANTGKEDVECIEFPMLLVGSLDIDGAPREFDIFIPFTAKIFRYDPARGNLLLDIDITHSGSYTGAKFLDSVTNSTTVSRLFNFGVQTRVQETVANQLHLGEGLVVKFSIEEEDTIELLDCDFVTEVLAMAVNVISLGVIPNYCQ